MRPFFFLLVLLCIISCTGPVLIDERDAENGTTESTSKEPVPIIHEGTLDSPYTIGEAQTLSRGEGVWIEGYIVGCVDGSIKNVDYELPASKASNILLSDTFPTDANNSLPVELKNSTTARDLLNLYDNPENMHQKLRIQGKLTQYFSVVGMRDIEDFLFIDETTPKEDDDEEENEKEEDNEQEEGDTISGKYKEFPMTITQGIELQSEDEYQQVWIKGYIIGYTTSKGKIYYDLTDIKSSANTNVILADSIEERDSRRVIAVELKSNSYIRRDVNLYDNPQNLHHTLTVLGHMSKYRDLCGCTDIPNGLMSGDSIIEAYYYLLE